VWGALSDVTDAFIERSTAKMMKRASFDAIEEEGTNDPYSRIDVRRPDGKIEAAFTYRGSIPL
jgi:hypothetical protein